MYTHNFTHKMNGLWITQSTYYSLNRNKNRTFTTFKNTIEWKDISCDEMSFEMIKCSLPKKYLTDLISLFQVDFLNTQSNQQKYYALLLKNKLQQNYLVKLDRRLQKINEFKIQELDDNYMYLTSSIKTLTLMERIYYLNNNVKVIKSVIKKSNAYIATSFSSEVKIS